MTKLLIVGGFIAFGAVVWWLGRSLYRDTVPLGVELHPERRAILIEAENRQEREMYPNFI